MIELIRDKRLRDKFKMEFGASIDEFFEDFIKEKDTVKKEMEIEKNSTQ